MIEPMFPGAPAFLYQGRFIGCCAGCDIWYVGHRLFAQYGPEALDYAILHHDGWLCTQDWVDALSLTDAELNEKMAQVELFRSVFAPEAAA